MIMFHNTLFDYLLEKCFVDLGKLMLVIRSALHFLMFWRMHSKQQKAHTALINKQANHH